MKKVETQIEKEEPSTQGFLKNLLTKSAKIKKIIKTSLFILLFLIISVGTTSPYTQVVSRKTDLGPYILEIRRTSELDKFNAKLKLEKPDLYVLGVRESAWYDTIPDYTAHNEFGYIGAWQIHVSYLPSLGIYGVTFEEFLENPDVVFPFEVQLQAIETLIEKNIGYLGWYYDYFPGKWAGKVQITKEGMIYAAHIGGAFGLKKLLMKNINPVDNYGTSIKDYLNYKNTFWYHID